MIKKICFYSSVGLASLIPFCSMADTNPQFSADQLYKPQLNGYFRSGIGTSKDSGGIRAENEYQKTLLGRLGNEYDTYSEIGLGSEVYNKDGKAFYADMMFSISSSGFSENEQTDVSDGSARTDDATFGLKQMNIRGKGLLNWDPEAIMWVGKRFYQRHDMHIIDSKYLDVSGYGAGIEHMSVGPGKLSVAWMRDDNFKNDTGTVRIGPNGHPYKDVLNVNIADIRYADLPVWEGGTMEFAIDYAMPNRTKGQHGVSVASSDADVTDGVSSIYYGDVDNSVLLTAILNQKVFGVDTETVLQYANSGYAHNMSSTGGSWYDGLNDNRGADGFKFINTANIQFTHRFSVDYVFVYGQANDIDADHQDQKLFDFVTRPIYQWDDYNKTMAEIGYFNLDADHGTDQSGHKFTIAQAWSAGPGLFARPEIRLYATYIKSDEGQHPDSIADGDKDSDIRFGVQGEVWW